MAAPCPRCKSSGALVRYELGSERIVRCSECSLLYLDPWPDPAAIEAVYGPTYFQNSAFGQGDSATLFGYSDYIAERANKQRQYARLAREIRGLLPPSRRTPRLLEVGCGLGYFLDEAFEEGFEVSGVEFNPYAVGRLRAKYAFPILSGALEAIDLEPGRYDAIAMYDVIEHLRDPFASLDKLHDALADGGLLVISTPDAESAVSRLLGARLEDFRRTREHLFFFGRATLHDVLREHGFDPIATRSIGHTFELGFLLDRLKLYNRPVFSALQRAALRTGLGSLQLEVNPHTKMIAFARKRARCATPAVPAQLAEASAVDHVLLDELEKLDVESVRHGQWLASVIGPWLGRSVLEVGSGIGVLSKLLLPRCERLVLSDHLPIYLERLRDRFGDLPSLRYQLLDLTRRPYRIDGEPVDTIVCLNVLEHLPDDDAVLSGLAELLPPGGRLILQVPRHPALFGSLDEAYGHLRRYRTRELRAQLERAGFRVHELRSFNALSIPGWFLSGRVLRRSGLDPQWLRYHEAAIPLARLLDAVTLHRIGISLIACAERISP